MPTSQPADDKRRKHIAAGIDRMKANHMSRQLQLRLQYARLKVEHGWQTQNLNEVENLYFRNSQIRMGDPPPQTGYRSVPQMFVPLYPPQHAAGVPPVLSFKFRPTLTPEMETSSRNVTFQENGAEAETSSGSNVPVQNRGSEQQGPSVAPESSRSYDVDTPAIVTESRPSTSAQNISESQQITTPSTATTPTVTTPASSSISVAPSQSSSQPAPTPYSSLASTYTPSTSTQINPSAASKLLSQHFPFGTTALTYDSFWSTHAGTNSQKVQKSTPGAIDRSPSLQNSGDVSAPPAVNNANGAFVNVSELPTARPYSSAGDSPSRREQDGPA